MANRIPISLDRPFLRDAIIEFRYEPQIEPELIKGLLFEKLRQCSWKLPENRLQLPIRLGQELVVQANRTIELHRGDFRLALLPDALSFNVRVQYPGYADNYRPVLMETLEHLGDETILHFTGVGLRYINDFAGIDIYGVIQRFMETGLEGFSEANRVVRWNFVQGETLIGVNIVNALPSKDNQDELGSVIDIDLQEHCESTVETKKVIALADRLHDLNKAILFGQLLPEDFVSRFGPTY